MRQCRRITPGHQRPDGADSAKRALREALSAVQRLLAPVLPFATEEADATIALDSIPAIFAIAYHSLVGSSGPVSRASSVIGCFAILG